MAQPTSKFITEEPQYISRKWYYTKEEIENHSPSRKDGIEASTESRLRKLYCEFLKDFGKTLIVPQMTIATAIMFCHRFYLRQSHMRNDWKLVATASIFLACKSEETPYLLKDVVVVAYELAHKWDTSAPKKIRQKEIYEKQKELVLTGEKLLLATLAFDLNIEHPYKPLVAALKRLEISHKDIAKVAWNFVNDWLCTILPLQYKPQYIAAASLFLAAKFHKVKLPTEKGKVWWLEFDISPRQLEVVIQHMLSLLDQTRKETPQPKRVIESTPEPEKKVISHIAKSEKTARPSTSGLTVESSEPVSQSAVSKFSKAHVSDKEVVLSQTSDCSSTHSVVEDPHSEGQPKTGEPAQKTGFGIVSVKSGVNKIDIKRLREKVKKRQLEKSAGIKSVRAINDEADNKAWIEHELENGIELECTHVEKKQRLD